VRQVNGGFLGKPAVMLTICGSSQDKDTPTGHGGGREIFLHDCPPGAAIAAPSV